MLRALFLLTLLPLSASAAPVVLVAEGERFKIEKGDWKATHQDDSYASHTYGGMWVSQGGLLGAPATSDGAIASYALSVPAAGKFKVWSKYQAPPYFQYPHRIEVEQKGKVVFSHVYGKAGVDRLWSFSGVSNELFWYWGVDHDAAEAGPGMVSLEAGPATVRLVTVKGEGKAPVGGRFVDFVVLTSSPEISYTGFKPYQIGSPFMVEALDATRLYARFQNASAKPAKMTASRAGHMQPNYGGATATFPAKDVPPGQWSEWFNIGPFCRLGHDEGLTLTLPGAATFKVQFARDAAGKDTAGEVTVAADSGAAIVPIDVTWNAKARVRTSKDHALSLIAASRKWRQSSKTKPSKVLFYGAFGGGETWVHDLKDALGYNTLLPDRYVQVQPNGVAAHYGSEAAIRGLAKTMTDAQKKRLRVVSFGDEISLGKINYKDPALNKKFRDWLAKRGVTAKDLGLPAGVEVTLDDSRPRLAWYSNLFNEEERFADYRRMTQVAKEVIGPHVLTGANYSPHHLALCYGPIFQWVDVFKHGGMSMFWAEDYIFSVPETPQILSWMYAQVHCATKYQKQPIHFYIMPHAPGQTAANLRRNLLFAIGSATAHVDNFWIGPPERFTENYVNYHYPDTYRVLFESMRDTAAVEHLAHGGTRRKAKVAVITGKATDYNESRLKRKKEEDPFFARSKNADALINQTLCRKEQQYLYLMLRHAQVDVDLITEDDIADGALKQYEVVYFAGEWVDRRVVPLLEKWVQGGGTLVATAGVGQRNEFDEPEPGLLKLLGLKSATMTKSLIAPRTLLELPLAEPIDTITTDAGTLEAYGMKQELVPATATVTAKWKDGKPAVTTHRIGAGRAVAVGTLAGMAYYRTGLKPIPYARGGNGTVYHPAGFDRAATDLARLGLAMKKEMPYEARTDSATVEALVLDNKAGTLLTLVNWNDRPAKGLKVDVRLPFKPAKARAITAGKALEVTYKDGVASFTIDLDEGDFVTLER